MNESEDLEAGNIKLSVFDSINYEELKYIIEAIKRLGYDCEFVDNGNIVFQKQEVNNGNN